MATQFPQQNKNGLIRQYFAHQQTMPYQAITPAPLEPVVMPPPSGISDPYSPQALPGISEQALPEIPEQVIPPVEATKKPQIRRVVAVILVCVLALSMYFIWRPSPSPTAATTPTNTTQQHFSLAPTASTLKTAATTTPTAPNGKIQVYIVGAVKNPGVYTLEGNARVYQLLQAAGGPLPEANLVALNLAAQLSDGQEIYVTRVGETPPASTNSASTTNTTGTTGGTSNAQVNINTASADELRKGLHISSTNAQAIINYRLQHGAFTSVEELLQVVSQATYKKIKDQVKLG